MKTLAQFQAAYRDRLAGLLLRGFQLAASRGPDAPADQWDKTFNAATIGREHTRALKAAYELIDEMYAWLAGGEPPTAIEACRGLLVQLEAEHAERMKKQPQPPEKKK